MLDKHPGGRLDLGISSTNARVSRQNLDFCFDAVEITLGCSGGCTSNRQVDVDEVIPSMR